MSVTWTADPSRGLRRRSATLVALAWCAAAAAGGAIGSLAGDARLCAAASAVAVALLQAALLGSNLRYGSAWFLASGLAGAAGMFLSVIGGVALLEAAALDANALGEGIAAWLVLGAVGGALLAATQAPLTGRRSLALTWLGLGAAGGAVLWPLGLWLGYRYGPALGQRMAELGLGLSEGRPVETASRLLGFTAAWLLHAIPFSLLFAGAERR